MGRTNMIPRASRAPTTIFALRFIFRFQMTNIGRTPRTMAVTAAKTVYEIVIFYTIVAGKHLPTWPKNCS
jgi:hypothetical protein